VVTWLRILTRTVDTREIIYYTSLRRFGFFVQKKSEKKFG